MDIVRLITLPFKFIWIEQIPQVKIIKAIGYEIINKGQKQLDIANLRAVSKIINFYKKLNIWLRGLSWIGLIIFGISILNKKVI